VAKQVVTQSNVERLVEHMFDQIFADDERVELLACIHEWERANPEVDPAHRVTGWIDVAYLYQAGLKGDHQRSYAHATTPRGLRTHPISGWGLAPAIG
jgi:hypothetical protein